MHRDRRRAAGRASRRQARPFAASARPTWSSLSIAATCSRQYLAGIALAAGVEQHEIAFELRYDRCRQQQRLHGHAAMALELDQVYAAIGRGILVLLADRLAEPLDLKYAGLVRQRLLGSKDAAMRVKRVDKRDRERA